MKHIIYHKVRTWIYPVLALPLIMSSCSEWDDHFEGNMAGSSDFTLMQLLEQDANTSRFAALVKQVGYDKVLNSSQSYTVFAPSNEAMAAFTAADDASVLRFVKNHIARYTQPSSTPATTGVQMLNGKIYYFDSASSFSGAPLSAKDEKAGNGILHELSAQVPYFSNLYEFISDNADYSKLYDFIHQYDEVKFDQENSIEIDVDNEGRPIYDSVWVSYNRLLDDAQYGIGQIHNEDSAYTMIIPDNKAWDAAYERISPSFKIFSTDQAYADSVQDIRTKQANVGNLVYRNIAADIQSADSIISTTGSVIRQVSDLFNGTTQERASNGQYFTTSNLGYNNAETWNKPIYVEAEEQNGRTYNNTLTTVYNRSAVASSPIQDISGDSYIEVQPISSTSNPVVIFDIPGTLSGKYNIYAVFLPAIAEGLEAATDSTRISFSLQYQNASGRNATSNNKSTKDEGLITKSGEITTMLAFSEFEFPVSNTTDRLWLMDENHLATDVETTAKLTIQTNVTAREFSSGTYARSFRIDRIILEPVAK